MLICRQSTARIVTVGPVLDADGVAVTGGVVGDFKISKNGGAPAALNGSATLTHRFNGQYSLSLTATDLDTVGTAEICIDDTVNACPIKELSVIEPAIYDTYYRDTANGGQYTAGTVFVDTVNGTSGTTVGIHGTDLTPCSTLAEAVTIAAALGAGVRKFHFTAGSSVTLASTYTAWQFLGFGWTLALGTQSCTNCLFEGATVSGTVTGSGNAFSSCNIGTATVPSCSLSGCVLTSTLTGSGTGTYQLESCSDGGAPGIRPVIDLGSAIGAAQWHLNDWQGELAFNNIKTGDEVDVTGSGVIENAVSSTGGTLTVTPNFTVLNSGATTVTRTAVGMASLTVSGEINAGTTTLSNLEITSDLTVSGSATIAQMTITADLNIGDDLNITGNLSILDGVTITKSVGNAMTIQGGTGSGACGLVIASNGTATSDALRLNGAASGSGIAANGGATGPAVAFTGGSTSGGGLVISTTSGTGIIAPSVTVSGAVAIGGALSAASFTVAGAVTVTGAFTASNDSNVIDLGSAERAAVATAWGARILGDSRTADMYLQGMTNKITFDVPATGQYTIYATDDVTPLKVGTYTATPGADPVTELNPA